jgi:hypothetical protein
MSIAPGTRLGLSVHDIGAADKVSYITSELVKGETVASLDSRRDLLTRWGFRRSACTWR